MFCHGSGGGRSVVLQSRQTSFSPALMRRAVRGVSNRSREKTGINKVRGGGGVIKRPREKIGMEKKKDLMVAPI